MRIAPPAGEPYLSPIGLMLIGLCPWFVYLTLILTTPCRTDQYARMAEDVPSHHALSRSTSHPSKGLCRSGNDLFEKLEKTHTQSKQGKNSSTSLIAILAKSRLGHLSPMPNSILMEPSASLSKPACRLVPIVPLLKKPSEGVFDPFAFSHPTDATLIAALPEPGTPS